MKMSFRLWHQWGKSRHIFMGLTILFNGTPIYTYSWSYNSDWNDVSLGQNAPSPMQLIIQWVNSGVETPLHSCLHWRWSPNTVTATRRLWRFSLGSATGTSTRSMLSTRVWRNSSTTGGALSMGTGMRPAYWPKGTSNTKWGTGSSGSKDKSNDWGNSTKGNNNSKNNNWGSNSGSNSSDSSSLENNSENSRSERGIYNNKYRGNKEKNNNNNKDKKKGKRKEKRREKRKGKGREKGKLNRLREYKCWKNKLSKNFYNKKDRKNFKG